MAVPPVVPPPAKVPPGQAKKPPKPPKVKPQSLAPLGLVVPGGIRNRVQQLGAPAVTSRILGYNTRGASILGTNAGRKYATKFTLASPGTLTELHGWFIGPGDNMIIYVYADSAGSPGARVAYTAPFALTGAANEFIQTGFSVALPAADYWVGWVAQSGIAAAAYYTIDAAIQFKGIGSGAAFNPPSDPFGTIDTSSPNIKSSCWGVVA